MSSELTALSGRHVVLAANNAEIGGGEVMLLHTARALAAARTRVTVVGPSCSQGVLDAAASEGFATIALGTSRRDYLRRLRRWDRGREGLLWAHGLVPALATAGHPDRIVHLHQDLHGAARPAARLALPGARRLLVPSAYLASRIAGSEVLENWTSDYAGAARSRPPQDQVTLGFIGRLTPDKGVIELASALSLLEHRHPGRFRLLLAGEPRFTDEAGRSAVERALASCSAEVDRLGWVDPPELFARSDIAVFPSRFQEPFGLVAAEAMSAGVPVVVTRAGALPEVVGTDHPWIAETGDAVSIAATILRCADTSDAERRVVAGRLRARWESRFSEASGRARVYRMLLSVLPPSAP